MLEQNNNAVFFYMEHQLVKILPASASFSLLARQHDLKHVMKHKKFSQHFQLLHVLATAFCTFHILADKIDGRQ